MTKLAFTKMHGLGNDFMVINAIKQPVSLTKAQLMSLSDRHFGIGFDQCLVIEASDEADIDFFYRIYNADGNEVAQCGNGARCLARYLIDNGLTQKKAIKVKTHKRELVLSVAVDDSITVSMGEPHFECEQIPMNYPKTQKHYSMRLNDDELITFQTVNMGNPHAVITVAAVANAAVNSLGPLFNQHEYFSLGVSLGFMHILDRQTIALRVYERGAGETLACGSGACAAVVAGIRAGRLHSAVEVQLPGGKLQIEWLGDGHDVMLTGPAKTVYHGTIELF